ncbi:phage shock protein C (PspC) family protein [Streptoalloteichus tenebrarius]|uniref:Phage shock protein C (PspC) family protein n=1 Tax=Streptoalloteichus tenebrarius (strain ATCC 17920 / DSM 40477 / JCM 4838 / CBS 697.72 / NBRC 16177 / NCIMB 11028 / NRRL B-12390 / A12253. 1 / ISP 5477) TaxID=1933 RepID=A0ABT1HZ12_STRSD|nr:PspC domain-containing protein [Streptoalloteichus tenebrarius]MCP2260763.1 phage shock protein C (PspC) family protein [Streptoalloteichus tenebrarius]BFF03423.1 PspC domain-containing protein [Streptoalloteichus tenebrarius]
MAIRMTRSDDRVLFGVAGGVARHFGWSPGKVRLAFVLSCLLPGPQFLLYLVLALLMPAPARH